ncbi:MAG: hypothetical protein ACOZQL_38465 [Myxococcota bacterium]
MGLPLLAVFVLHSAPPQVLVYLANEPAPTATELENITRIAGWLEESTEESDHILAQGIREDLKTFPEVVAADVATIRRHAATLDGVVIAHNQLVKTGNVLIGRGERLETVPISLVQPADGREASNPLANLQNVAAVIELAARAFDPQEFEFVIVVESHGDESYAITPRLGLPTDGLTKDTLFERVHGADNPFIQRYGVKTSELLDLLALKRNTIEFRTKLLVLASCESTVELLPPALPAVLVAADGLPLEFGSVDFEKVLRSNESALDRRLLTVLTSGAFEIADPTVLPRRRLSRGMTELGRRLLYFIPLTLWFAVFVLRRRVNPPRRLRNNC